MRTCLAAGIAVLALLSLIPANAAGQARLQIRIIGPENRTAEVYDPIAKRWDRYVTGLPIIMARSSAALAGFATRRMAPVYDPAAPASRGRWSNRVFTEHMTRMGVAGPMAVFAGDFVGWVYDARRPSPWSFERATMKLQFAAVSPNLAAIASTRGIWVYDAQLGRWFSEFTGTDITTVAVTGNTAQAQTATSTLVYTLGTGRFVRR